MRENAEYIAKLTGIIIPEFARCRLPNGSGINIQPGSTMKHLTRFGVNEFQFTLHDGVEICIQIDIRQNTMRATIYANKQLRTGIVHASKIYTLYADGIEFTSDEFGEDAEAIATNRTHVEFFSNCILNLHRA